MTTDKVAVGGTLEELMVRSGRFFTRGEESADTRSITHQGGRAGDIFYRDRWSHDKVVRSTHGVNCTGSCSWKIYVKDGIITWETQETDYPTVGADRPEYEPRGCPRGAAFSWYTYSPTRVRYPYARGVLVEMYREAKQRLGDPVLAWADIQNDPERRRRYQRARGKGGLVRVTWAEATEMVAAAHVHTIKEYGPDRIAGFAKAQGLGTIDNDDATVLASGVAVSPISGATGTGLLAILFAYLVAFFLVVSQAVVVGSGRKQVGALIVPDWEALKDALKEDGIAADGNREELCENPHVIKRMQRDAVDLTRELSDYERVKRVYLLPREFSIDKGEMTPTLKIKRGVIDEKYEEAIDEICGS